MEWMKVIDKVFGSILTKYQSKIFITNPKDSFPPTHLDPSHQDLPSLLPLQGA